MAAGSYRLESSSDMEARIIRCAREVAWSCRAAITPGGTYAPRHPATPMILSIETSCDETSVALLERDGTVRVNHIASQIERHQPFGGVVPEIASREHLAHLFPLVTRALADGGAAWNDVEEIAVTSGPGLIGALLVGVAGAQG